jgi:energy-coupling factor transporter ATP-binding protein EcfA2
MKIKFSSSLLRLLLAASLGTLASVSLRADEEGATAKVKLSSPDKPATFRIEMPWADIHIVGIDGDTVTVESSLNEKGKDNRDDGLRRLDDEVSFELTEHENTVSLSIAGGNPWAAHDGDFKISVPRAIALDIKTETGGDLEIKDVVGDIEVNNMNGEVRLDGLAGSTVVNTMNGEVHAVYAKPPQKLVSITSMNGEIDLRVPSETKANVRLRTHNGSILTDFNESVLKTKSEGKSFGGASDAARIGADAARAAADAVRTATEVAQEFAREVKRQAEGASSEESVHSSASSSHNMPRPPRPPRPPMPPITGGKLVSGTLNGGGVDIKISTMNGEITLRQTSSSVSTETVNTADGVTVVFQDPDNFTDVRDSHTNMNSSSDLDELRDYVQKTATPLLAGGSKLTITFLDIDLAGDIRPDKDNIRFMTGTTIPRAHVKFQLIGGNGKVTKEGDRKLSDMNYQNSIRTIGRDDPLFYDKQLLKEWITKEFKGKS